MTEQGHAEQVAHTTVHDHLRVSDISSYLKASSNPVRSTAACEFNVKVYVAAESGTGMLCMQNRFTVHPSELFRVAGAADRGTGWYELTVKTPPKSGVYPFTLLCMDVVISNMKVAGDLTTTAPLVLVIASHASMSASSIRFACRMACVGVAMKGHVYIRDEFGNTPSFEEHAFAALVESGPSTRMTYTTEVDAEARALHVQLMFSQRGMYNIGMYYGDRRIGMLDCQVTGGDEPCARLSILRAASTPTLGPMPSYASLEAHDKSGAALAVLPPCIRVFVQNKGTCQITGMLQQQVSDRGVGSATYLFDYPTCELVPGEYTMHAQITDQDITGSPIHVQLHVDVPHVKAMEREEKASEILNKYQSLIQQHCKAREERQELLQQIQRANAVIEDSSIPSETSAVLTSQSEALLQLAVPSLERKLSTIQGMIRSIQPQVDAKKSLLVKMRAYLELLQ